MHNCFLLSSGRQLEGILQPVQQFVGELTDILEEADQVGKTAVYLTSC